MDRDDIEELVNLEAAAAADPWGEGTLDAFVKKWERCWNRAHSLGATELDKVLWPEYAKKSSLLVAIYIQDRGGWQLIGRAMPDGTVSRVAVRRGQKGPWKRWVGGLYRANPDIKPWPTLRKWSWRLRREASPAESEWEQEFDRTAYQSLQSRPDVIGSKAEEMCASWIKEVSR